MLVGERRGGGGGGGGGEINPDKVVRQQSVDTCKSLPAQSAAADCIQQRAQIVLKSISFHPGADLLLQYNPGPGEYSWTPASTSQAQHPSTCFLSNVSRLHERRYVLACPPGLPCL